MNTNNDEDHNVVQLDDVQLIQAKKRFTTLWNSLFGEISSMLGKAKLFPIHELVGVNPSFAELVANLKSLRETIELLKPLLPGTNAAHLSMIDEYIDLAEALADSIDARCSDSLGAAIAALDEKPYI